MLTMLKHLRNESKCFLMKLSEECLSVMAPRSSILTVKMAIAVGKLRNCSWPFLYYSTSKMDVYMPNPKGNLARVLTG